MSIVSVYAVFADAHEAEAIARTVIDEHLAACVNILAPVRSIYRWDGLIRSSDEVAAIFKTSAAAAQSLIRRIAELHSYEVPCVASWPIAEILPSYAEFVEASVG